jgi:hypothetical protein
MRNDLIGAVPPPLAPPLKGEGELPRAKSPCPFWGGVRGGGELALYREGAAS